MKSKISKITLILIFRMMLILTVFQILACQSTIKINSSDMESENKPINSFLEKKEENHPQLTGSSDPDLEKSQELWKNQKIDNYNYTASLDRGLLANIATPVLIKVREGRMISIERASKSDARDVDKYSPYEKIDQLFDKIQQELEKGESYVTVKYNKKYGYPEYINLRYKSALSDGRETFKITKFEIIK